MKANKTKINNLLKTARGQVDGLLKMVEEDRYCIDICNQLMATQAILHSVNKEILHAHLNHCVKEAFQHGNGDEKIEEIMSIMDKMGK
ncbi:MAG TPA: transcriptional regulator [Syntrophomonas sp.]|jgi:DNA-binding FrmR family transcriptional regulator|nr:transcriptional regulator [Syntrophomonas sp.]HCF71780.1 transcriptional regulator [Syntrophomonas sp.]